MPQTFALSSTSNACELVQAVGAHWQAVRSKVHYLPVVPAALVAVEVSDMSSRSAIN